VTLVDRDFRKVSSVEKLQLGNTASSVTIGNFAVAAGIDTVTGGDEADTINASSAPTSMTLNGDEGNDTITGGDEADVIDGGDDNDVITGGAGADDMTGGAGADTFVFAAGDSGTISGTVFDIVRDYVVNTGGDTLDLVGAAAAEADVGSEDVKGAITGGGGTEIVTASTLNGVITLAGANSGDIDSLAEWLAVARLVVTNDTKVGAFEFGGDTYVYQENTGGDLLIQLDNVTGITAVGVAAAANTILVA
jgi:Ca2+-binding RTX toxin-like protein